MVRSDAIRHDEFFRFDNAMWPISGKIERSTVTANSTSPDKAVHDQLPYTDLRPPVFEFPVKYSLDNFF